MQSHWALCSETVTTVLCIEASPLLNTWKDLQCRVQTFLSTLINFLTCFFDGYYPSVLSSLLSSVTSEQALLFVIFHFGLLTITLLFETILQFTLYSY